MTQTIDITLKIVAILISIAFLFSAYKVLSRPKGSLFKKKGTSVNLPLFVQQEYLLTSGAIKDFPFAHKAMEEAMTIYSDELVSTTTQTTTEESVEI